METECGTISKSSSKNMSINKDNCLESSDIESTSDSLIGPTTIQVRWVAKNVIRNFITNI